MEMKQEQVTIGKGYRQGSTTSTALWGYAAPINMAESWRASTWVLW